ncbi:ash family protein [Salmonella enterica]|uniref:Ash family protein n=3 Tax=Salmonella enterica TaxID=28901 RepID=A0A8F7UZ42_SALER|nr:ash family protein [Salmonella enterica]EEO2935995.1 ash family protein [Salmonella enterica subsp. salamae]EGD6365393.1 ash family protein [Salmonella enterica]EHC8753687.1 ash family protein [Salmonella enterica]EHC8757870.1 ash family protein [Salmonella enterica]EHC8812840.1 ash family protein [Salmonella enterica]
MRYSQPATHAWVVGRGNPHILPGDNTCCYRPDLLLPLHLLSGACRSMVAQVRQPSGWPDLVGRFSTLIWATAIERGNSGGSTFMLPGDYQNESYTCRIKITSFESSLC